MGRRRQVIALATGLTVLGAGLGSVAYADRWRQPRQATAEARPAGDRLWLGRLNYHRDRHNSPAVQAARWPFQVLQYDHGAEARQIRAAARGRVELVFYMAPMSARPGDVRGHSTPLLPADLERHPEFRLLDTAGHPIHRDDNGAGPDSDVMLDPGNAAYQRYSADRLVRMAKRGGWDGVLLDEINQTWAWNMRRDPRGYRTQAEWQRAVLGYVRTVCGALVRNGRTCHLNTGADRAGTAFWDATLAASSGAMQEFFVAMDPAVGGAPARATVENGWWAMQVDRIRRGELAGKRMIGRAYASDQGAVDYALGSYLLGTNHHGAFVASRVYDGNDDRWSPLFDQALRLGKPKGPMRRVGYLRWRDFDHGYLVVNPHGAPHSGRDGGHAVSLRPTEARIVVRGR